MHADIAFTPLERTLIAQAVRDLTYQTAGYLTVELEYDLATADVVQPNILARAATWDTVTLRVEAAKGITALGFTRPDSRQAFLVADRLATPEMWRHVTMHELLHAAGLDDLPKNDADIMSGQKTHIVALCMSRKDALEFCRVNHCDSEELNYCRSPG
jgi:hypothetical protein